MADAVQVRSLDELGAQLRANGGSCAHLALLEVYPPQGQNEHLATIMVDGRYVSFLLSDISIDQATALLEALGFRAEAPRIEGMAILTTYRRTF